MDRWEYLFVHIAPAGGFNEIAYRPYKTHEKRLPNWKSGPTWMEYFTKLGQEGWEFVTFETELIDEPAIGGKIAVFKRCQPDKPAPAPPAPSSQQPQVRRIAPSSPPPFIEE